MPSALLPSVLSSNVKHAGLNSVANQHVIILIHCAAFNVTPLSVSLRLFYGRPHSKLFLCSWTHGAREAGRRKILWDPRKAIVVASIYHLADPNLAHRTGPSKVLRLKSGDSSPWACETHLPPIDIFCKCRLSQNLGDGIWSHINPTCPNSMITSHDDVVF